MKKYLRSVRSAFPVYGKNEKRFIRDFKLNILEYTSIHPNCSENELSKKFGAPKEIVIEYFNNMDSKKYLVLMKKAFYIKVTMVVSLTLMIIFFFFQTYSLYLVRKEAMETIITTEDTQIIYNTTEREK